MHVCVSVFLHASTACVPLIILIRSSLCSLLIPLHIFNSVKHKYRGSHPTAHKTLVLIDQPPRERNTDMSFHSITVGGLEKATCMMNIAGVKLIALQLCWSVHPCVCVCVCVWMLTGLLKLVSYGLALIGLTCSNAAEASERNSETPFFTTAFQKWPFPHSFSLQKNLQ